MGSDVGVRGSGGGQEWNVEGQGVGSSDFLEEGILVSWKWVLSSSAV